MKKTIYYIVITALLFTNMVYLGCKEDANPSLYEIITPVGELPVSMFFNFDEKLTGIPYAITSDNNSVYVSVSGQGIKKIIKQATKDTLVTFSPKGAETFFNSLTYAGDGNIYATRRVRGLVQAVENTAPVTFVASSQGIDDNLNDVEFDNIRNVLWSGGNTGIIYSITLDKIVKKFTRISGNITALKPAHNSLYVAFRDTSNHEVIWKFPIISADSIGTGELFFNFTLAVDTLARITDIAVAEDEEVFVFSNTQANAVTGVRSVNVFGKAFSGLIAGSPYSVVWGTDNFAYFSNIVSGVNSDVWKIDMKKSGAP